MLKTWKLRLPLLNLTQQQVCRHAFEALRHDPNVLTVYYGRANDTPYHADLNVTFREGSDQPANPAFRAFNMLYPENPPTQEFPILQVATSEECSVRRDRSPSTIIRETLSYEYSPRIQPFPDWVVLHRWVQHRFGVRAQIVKILPGEISSVLLREWREHRPLMRITVSVTALEEDWGPIAVPVEGIPWYQRLLDDDPY